MGDGKSAIERAQVTITIVDANGYTSTSAQLHEGKPPEHHIAERVDEFRRSRAGALSLPLVIHYSEQA